MVPSWNYIGARQSITPEIFPSALTHRIVVGVPTVSTIVETGVLVAALCSGFSLIEARASSCGG